MSEDMKYFELSSSCGSGSNRNIVPFSRKITQSYISYIFSVKSGPFSEGPNYNYGNKIENLKI